MRSRLEQLHAFVVPLKPAQFVNTCRLDVNKIVCLTDSHGDVRAKFNGIMELVKLFDDQSLDSSVEELVPMWKALCKVEPAFGDSVAKAKLSFQEQIFEKVAFRLSKLRAEAEAAAAIAAADAATN